MPTGVYKRKKTQGFQKGHKINLGRKGKNASGWKGGKIEVICQYCSKKRKVYPSAIKNGEGKYCSKKCKYLFLWKGGSKLAQKRYYNNHKNNLKYQLNRRISEGIHNCLKKGIKNGRHWGILVPYNYKQLKKCLEKKFNENMNWDNYGSYWHIDHEIPISAFSFTKPEDLQFQQCWALSNLRPLEKKENLKKHNKIIKPFQIGLAI